MIVDFLLRLQVIGEILRREMWNLFFLAFGFVLLVAFWLTVVWAYWRLTG